MSIRILEVKLKKIHLNYRGQHTRSEDVNVFSFALHYPSAGKKSANHVKTFPIEKSQNKTITVDFNDKSYQDQVIFKESIQGDTNLTLEVGNVNKLSGFSKFFTGVFKDILSARVRGVDFSSTSKTSAAKSFGGSFLEALIPEDKLDILAKLSVDLSQDELETLLGTEQTYPLKALKTIKNSEEFDEEGDTIKEEPEIIIKEGEQIGEVTLAFKQI